MPNLIIRYNRKDTGDTLIGVLKISHNSIAFTIAQFEEIKREHGVQVTHYLNVDKIYGFGNPDSDWIKVPYYLT